ncbi:MAG: GNAT family N-acetyltransferase [Rhodobacteraceae bacterium]|nr:GNAT family N-acetyltransferase [Paracoccaceae bacterium]
MTTPDPKALARLHAQCFQTPRPWSEAEFAGFLRDPACLLQVRSDGDALQCFALFRQVLEEAELLTLAVAPSAQGQGIARDLLLAGSARMPDAVHCILEVARDNLAARALYARLGFFETGCRPRYYRADDGTTTDALILRAAMPLRVTPARMLAQD